MLPLPFAPFIDRSQDYPDLHRANEGTQSFAGSRNKPTVSSLTTQNASTFKEQDRENNHKSAAKENPKVVFSLQGQQSSQQRRRVLGGNIHSPMTPTGLVSTTTTSRSSNWFELAVKAKAASLREAQRKMSTPASLPTEAPAEEQAGSSSKAGDSAATLEDVEMQAPQGPASGSPPSPSPAVNILASSEPTAPTETQPAVAVAAQAPSPLAGGLVGASSSTASDAPPAQNIATAAATAFTQPPIIATLLTPNTSRNVPLEGDELRTEVMGPPPTLPADPAYPPLIPALTDVPVQAPNPKRRGPSTAANGTQRKPAPQQAPADFVPPVNANGKMPFALFQTLKKTPAESSKDSTDAHRSQRYVDTVHFASQEVPPDFHLVHVRLEKLGRA